MSSRVVTITFIALISSASLYFYLKSDDSSQYLVFSTWGTPTEVESFQRLIDYFNTTRNPKHKVRLAHAQGVNYAENLLVQAAAYTLPDVIHLDSKDLSLFARRGLLEDLTPHIEHDAGFDTAAFFPELLRGCRTNGRSYGVPHNFSTLVLYYNKTHFEAEGLSSPDSSWTWDAFLHAAQRLTKRDDANMIVRYGCYVIMIARTIIQQFGGSVLNEDLDSCVIASPEAASAIQFITDLSEKYHVAWSVLTQDLAWDDMFIGGRCSMVTNGRWAAAWYMKSMPPRSVDVAPIPRGKFRKYPLVNHVMTISAQSTKKEEAWEFVKFLASEPAQRMVNDDGANIPALRSIAISDEFLKHRTTPTMQNRVFLDEIQQSVLWPSEQGPYLTQFTIHSQTDLMMRRILLGEASTMQSLTIMQDNLNQIIATHRQVPEPKRFVGSVVFYLCCALPVAALSAFWLRRKRNVA